MSDERRYWFVIDKGKLEYVQDNVTGGKITVSELEDLLNEQQAIISALKEENEQLRNELTFLNKVISFFADNPMTKYSSKSELLEEMRLLEEMGLI